MATHTFIVSDESINTYGYRVLTSGIDLTAFKKNPIALWMHNRGANWQPTVNDQLPIGRWENLRKEDGKLMADLVFDTDDDFAKKLESKVQQNILRATSIGFKALKTSSDEKDMEKGQKYATVTKAELIEISLVDIPANKNAIKLYDVENNVLSLSDGNEIPEILKIQSENDEPNINKNSKTMTYDELKASHPALFAQVLNEGKEAGKEDGRKEEKIRTKAWLAHVKSDSERVLKGIKEDEELTSDIREELFVAAQLNRRAGKEENADDLDTTAEAKKAKEAMDAALKEDVESLNTML